MRHGAGADDIRHFEDEMEAFEHARDWARAGELVIMLALGGAAPVQARLRELVAR